MEDPDENIDIPADVPEASNTNAEDETEQIPVAEDENAAAPPEDEEEKPVVDTEILSAEMIGQHISLLARTGNGLSHAYTKLEMHGKSITNIDILENYVHLRYIDLAENSISDISSLASLEYLLSINFHSNKIRKIPANLDRRKYLQQANFAKNMIDSIEIVTWPMLAWLNLNENKLRSCKLQQFEELTHLEARANKITSMKEINARKLEKLYLAGNEIAVFDLEDKPNLQVLHLRDNKIVSLQSIGESFKSLTYINLRNNLIDSLDEITRLGVVPNLKILNLTDNPVTKAANYRIETIYRCKNLEKLDKELVTDEEREEAATLKPKPAELAPEVPTPVIAE
ncbi:Leucine-rich repeat-containing protein 23 [Entophlyctis sp. JEL0112]|nr:Leucine-rich repeat-containing protein 23 [Entophlyctis sp. JEL0112]